jgi:thiol-disulfide isomerase/thioredoxin
MSFFSKLRTAGSLPVQGHLPGFDGATGWLNSPPLSAADLDGKVVLVDFWTYTCINWLRTLAYVRAWAERYQDHGLVVVGVHTPEGPDELPNPVQRALVAGATPDESPPGQHSHGEGDRAWGGYRADSGTGAAGQQLCGG